jgi:hypothetical protein
MYLGLGVNCTPSGERLNQIGRLLNHLRWATGPSYNPE